MRLELQTHYQLLHVQKLQKELDKSQRQYQELMKDMEVSSCQFSISLLSTNWHADAPPWRAAPWLALVPAV